MPSTCPAPARTAQNIVIDQHVSTRPANARRVPLSLRPGEQVVMAAAEGNKQACAIRDAWKPRFAVTRMTSAEIAALSNLCSVTFSGSGSSVA
jgi:hypothetical protein